MVFSLHLQRSAVAEIVGYPDRDQLIVPLSLKKAALQWAWLLGAPNERRARNLLIILANLQCKSAFSAT
jgi:hypothetical protein